MSAIDSAGNRKTPESDRGGIEKRSIDYIPHDERHGKPWHQGPFWFTTNFNLVTVVTGFIGPSLGLAAGWSVLAVVLGALFGTFFMAFHANQGPRLGLPQMIQSRAQFGIKGAIIPFIATVFVYIGFNVFNTIVSTDALQTVMPAPDWFWYPLIIITAMIVAVIGHDFMHCVQRWLMPVLIIIFVGITIATVSLKYSSIVEGGSFTWVGFLAAFGAAAGYQLSYAVYVSDYSRYLPKDVSAPRIISWTYAGQAGAAVWLMSLGALFGSAFSEPDVIATLQNIGNTIFPGFGTVVVLVSVLPLVMIISVNAYGAMLTGTSAVDAFREVNPSLRIRVIGLAMVSAVALAITLSIPSSYMGSFGLFVALILYFLVPWTAVNLVDFYFVRHGRYAITELFKRDSVYGQWGWRGTLSYAVGFIAMVPFFSTAFYTGAIAKAMDGADLAFIVGLVISGALYYVLTINLSVSEEARQIKDEESWLE